MYETSDLSLASYIMLKDNEIKSIEPIRLNSNLYKFLFDITPQKAFELHNELENSEIKKYFDCVAQLKTLMNEDKLSRSFGIDI